MPSSKYSDIKKFLRKRRAELLSADAHLDQDIRGHDADSRHGDDMDAAEMDKEQEIAFRLKTRGHEEIRQIDEALERIEAGDYGECDECGEQIPHKRLEVLPYSLFCVACQEEQEEAAKAGILNEPTE